MKRNRIGKLGLKRETICKLDQNKLSAVAGGTWGPTLPGPLTDPIHGESGTFQVCDHHQH